MNTYQRCDEIAVVVAHHTDLLRLLQHLVDPLGRTVEHDVRFGRVFDLLQQRAARGKHKKADITD